MDRDEMDRILQHTLQDAKLSRGEKRVLRRVLEETGADEADRAVLRARAFDLARREIQDLEARRVLDWLEETLKVLLPSDQKEASPEAEAFFSPDDDCATRIAGLFRTARSRIDVCVFTITDDRITEAISETHGRGVDIRLITDNDKSLDRGSDIRRLERSGVPVRVDRTEYHMHHKFAVFDRRLALTGSYNWTRSASRYNEENLIVSGDRRLVRAFERAFDRLWERLG